MVYATLQRASKEPVSVLERPSLILVDPSVIIKLPEEGLTNERAQSLFTAILRSALSPSRLGRERFYYEG